jgi:hypothetical protein
VCQRVSVSAVHEWHWLSIYAHTVCGCHCHCHPATATHLKHSRLSTCRLSKCSPGHSHQSPATATPPLPPANPLPRYHCHTTCQRHTATHQKKSDFRLVAYQNDPQATASNLPPLPPSHCHSLTHCHCHTATHLPATHIARECGGGAARGQGKEGQGR